MVPFDRQLPTVIRPHQIAPDVTYEPLLRVGFGINDQTVAGAKANDGPDHAGTRRGSQPPHYHTANDVCWHILSGRVRAWFARSDGGDRKDVILASRAGPSTSSPMPRPRRRRR
jgi:mannose-6-phosphate isomerase-like protein (cupin superfamily)